MVDDQNNFDEAREALEDGLEAGLVNLHDESLDRLDKNMRRGKDALGNPWAPLQESTIRAKGHDTPLIETRTLLSDLMATSQVYRSELVAVIGSTLDYLVHHEFGAPEAGIPARPVLGPVAQYAEQRAPEVIGTEIDTRLEQAEVD
ncbi:hypothetical protein GWK26_12625 [haloarchaeon 3A1-DGR]|nr:hypothetical protein GWK26_12625 [haloarchaeon 3A1-DGR]